jgi:IS605 family transposase
MAELASEVRNLSAYATYTVRNDEVLGAELSLATATAPAEVGRQAGVVMPDFLVPDKKGKDGNPLTDKNGEPIKLKTGKSRKERLFRHRVVTEYRAWQERIAAASGESSKYVSQGWKRTVNASAPSYGDGDFINLGAVDKRYAVIENNPLIDGEIVLKLVIQGKWYRLIFSFNNKRFTEGKVTLPLVKIENGKPVFIFTVVTDNPVVQFSGDYTVGVDVGINDYATVVVRNSNTGHVVHETTLSQRVHSLWNSIKASERQVRALNKKADKLLHHRQVHMSAIDEAQFHREAASRKKRELAILAAQEIAYLAHSYGNAVVAVEDLSWIRNTMQNGRWNRGAFVQWLNHYVAQNGGWVVSVNAANTSQVCHLCGEKVAHPEYKVSVCPKHGAIDRDVNAAANVAARAVSKVEKARKTRAKNRKLQQSVPLKTPIARDSLKYPGRDRTKRVPTPKRKKRVVREVNLPFSPARVIVTSVLADCDTYGAVETCKAAINQGNVTCECRLYSLN